MSELAKNRTIRVREHTRDGVRVEEHDRTIRQRASDAIRNDEGEVHTWVQAVGAVFAGYLAYRGLNKISAIAVSGTWRSVPRQAEAMGYDRLTTMKIPRKFDPVLDARQSYFTPDAYRHLQGSSYADTVRRVESAIKGLPVEHAFLIDRKGKILAAYRGGIDQTGVVLPAHTIGWSSRNMTLTHNHPARLPYSGGDLIGQYQMKLGRMRAVEPDGTVTQMLYRNHRDIAPLNTLAQMKRNDSVQVPLIQRLSGSKNPDSLPIETLLQRLDGNAEYRRVMTDAYHELSRRTGGVWKYEELGRIVKRDGGTTVDNDELLIEGEIAKLDDEQRQVFGWASITEINGEPVVDLQGDVIETYELEKAAYDYVLNSRVGGEMHERVGKSSPKQIGTLIESMVLTPEKIEKMGLPDTTPHGWWIGFQVAKDETGDAAWDAVKKGKYTGFSIHGLGKRKSMETLSKALATRSPDEIIGWVERIGEQIGVEPRQLARDLAEFLDSTGAEGTDDEIHDFLLEQYGSGEMVAKKEVNVKAHERGDTKVKAHTRGGGKGKVAGAAGVAASVAALSTPAGRRLLRHSRSYGAGSPTQFAAGRQLPSGPARGFGTGRDFAQGFQGDFIHYNPSRMFSAGQGVRNAPQSAFRGASDFAADSGAYARGLGRGFRAAGREATNQTTRRAAHYGRRADQAFGRAHRRNPELTELGVVLGLYGGIAGTAYGVDRGLQAAIPSYGEYASGQRQEQRQRRQQTRDNIRENLRRRTGRSEGEPARIRARKMLKEEIDKHLLGRHDQKDHDPTKKKKDRADVDARNEAMGVEYGEHGSLLYDDSTKGHSRSDHTGILRRDGNALAERRQQRAFDREMDKVAEDASWQLLMEEVGESEAAHFNVETRDRYNEIYEQARSMLDQRLGADDVKKHLVGQHDQKKHGNRRHTRDQHDKGAQVIGGAAGAVAGLAGAGIGGALVGGLIGADQASRAGVRTKAKWSDKVDAGAQERLQSKQIEELAWAQLVHEVGESEAAYLNRATLDRYEEIHDEFKTLFGPTDQRPVPGQGDGIAGKQKSFEEKYGPLRGSPYIESEAATAALERLVGSSQSDDVKKHLNAKPIRTNEELEQRRRDALERANMEKRFLVAKAAEKASTREEFAKNVLEIADAVRESDHDAAVYFDDVHKHLIGRHEQKDHDPTKKGKNRHKRSEHGTAADPGLLSDTQRRMRLNPAASVLNPLNAVSGLTGTTMLWSNNWGRRMPFMDNRQVFESDVPSVTSRGVLQGGPIGAGLGAGLGAWSEERRRQRGAPGVRTFDTSVRRGGRREQLTKHQREVLEKYLGPIDLGDEQ